MKRVAVTGATGFAGRQAVSRFLEAGFAVKALVRHGSPARLPPSVESVSGDLGDHAALRQLVDQADCVVHLAGAISGRKREDFFRVNADGTRNLVAAIKTRPSVRLIHVSSLAAREPQLSDYAASKHESEAAALAHALTLVLRPSAIYGPEDKATLPLLQQLAAPLAVLPGKRASRFSLVHVRDFAAVLAEAVESTVTGTIEVDDTDGPHDWAKLAAMSRALFDRPKHFIFLPQTLAMAVARAAETAAGMSGRISMITAGKMRELYHDNWIASPPGWPRSHPIRLAEGLKSTFDWYMGHGWIKPVTRTS